MRLKPQHVAHVRPGGEGNIPSMAVIAGGADPYRHEARRTAGRCASRALRHDRGEAR